MNGGTRAQIDLSNLQDNLNYEENFQKQIPNDKSNLYVLDLTTRSLMYKQ